MMHNNACACPVIGEFVDRMPPGVIDEGLYDGVHQDVLRVRTGDADTMRRRAFVFADWAVRRIAPMVLRRIGRETEAGQLESLAEIVDRDTAAAAHAAAHAAARLAARLADQAASLASACEASVAARAAACAARVAEAADAAADAAYYAACASRTSERVEESARWAARSAARAAAGAAAYAADEAWRLCADVVREAALLDR